MEFVMDCVERIDLALTRLITDTSRSQVHKWIESKLVLDSKQSPIKKASYKTKPGELIYFDDQAAKSLEKASTVTAKAMDLEILFEDEELIILNKPRGLVVYPGAGREEMSLLHALKYHCGSKLSAAGGGERPGIVHRLDKDTSGLMVVAKTDQSHRSLAEAIRRHEVERRYRCICHGRFREQAGCIEGGIARDPNYPTRMSVQSYGKAARTHFERLDELWEFTKLSLKLETGRTHQIRVHLAAIHHPILGDSLYGGADDRFPEIKGQLLYSASIRLRHPRSAEELAFEIDEPEYFQNAWTKLQS
ncbi:MAG: RluA family pseudouridine synthase [Eubacteriales bacterium]|nr:RluA family pseudouridine synthase [Eubacteriales bacterium]